MVETTSEDIWESAFRAYLLLRLLGQADRTSVAEEIFALNLELGISNHFVIRATLVKNTYDVIVPVCARDPERLGEIIEHVMSRDRVDRERSEVVYEDDTLEADQVHEPYPPHKAPGYIPRDEANPVEPGPLGNNAWG